MGDRVLGLLEKENHICIRKLLQNDGMGLNIAGGNDWTNIIIPGEANSPEFHHEKTFLLADLAHDAQYECLVQAKNQYGWSEASRIHRFLTHSNAFGTLPCLVILLMVISSKG